jgi:Domain of unknown function (DUF5050)
MNNKLLALTVTIVTSIMVAGCLDVNNPIPAKENKPVLISTACSTTVIGTVPPYTNIEFDGSAFYFIDDLKPIVYSIDKNSGSMKSQSIQTTTVIENICMDSEYLYVNTGFRQPSSVYRLHKNMNTSPELLFTAENAIRQIKAGGNRLYFDFYRTSDNFNRNELYCYDIQLKKTVKIQDQTNLFDTDNDFVYWSKTDSLTNERTLGKTPHGGTTTTELAKGKIWADKMLGEYIYYWDENDNLLRISKHNSQIEKFLSSPAGLNEDNGYVVWDDVVYMTDCYPLGILSGLQINNPQKGFVTLEKKGHFDEDDMACWLWTDKQALYWVAGPDTTTSISDEQWGTLFKTYVNKEILFK